MTVGSVRVKGIEGSDDEALDTGHDEEVSRWEQEQIRKGISIPQVSSHTQLLAGKQNMFRAICYDSFTSNCELFLIIAKWFRCLCQI